MNRETRQWLDEVRAKQAEHQLPEPVLEHERPLKIKADHLPTTPDRPARLLRVSTPYFCAGSTWQQLGGIWSCTFTAPILHWMRGISASQAKLALLKMGADWQWLPLSDRAKSRSILNPGCHGTGPKGSPAESLTVTPEHAPA